MCAVFFLSSLVSRRIFCVCFVLLKSFFFSYIFERFCVGLPFLSHKTLLSPNIIFGRVSTSTSIYHSDCVVLHRTLPVHFLSFAGDPIRCLFCVLSFVPMILACAALCNGIIFIYTIIMPHISCVISYILYENRVNVFALCTHFLQFGFR